MSEIPDKNIHRLQCPYEPKNGVEGNKFVLWEKMTNATVDSLHDGMSDEEIIEVAQEVVRSLQTVKFGATGFMFKGENGYTFIEND